MVFKKNKKLVERDIKEITEIEHDTFFGHALVEINGKKYICDKSLEEARDLIINDDMSNFPSYKYIEITEKEIKSLKKELELFANRVYAKIDFKLLLKESLKAHIDIKQLKQGNKILKKNPNAKIESKKGCYNLIVGEGKDKLDLHMF